MEAVAPLWREMAAKARSRTFQEFHQGREVNLAVVPCAQGAHWSRSGTSFYLCGGPDALVGFQLGDRDAAPLTLRVTINGHSLGEVRAGPRRLSYALQDIHCLPLVCIDAAEIMVSVVDPPGGMWCPNVHMVMAFARHKHRRALAIFRSTFWDAPYGDRPALRIQLRDRTGYVTNGEWQTDERPRSVVHTMPPMRDLPRAADVIRRAYLHWKWRKEVLWNPHTEVGHLHLLLKARLSCRSGAL